MSYCSALKLYFSGLMGIVIKKIIWLNSNNKEGVILKLGVALSGGGIRGIAHAGALKALDDNGIKIDAIGGTSSGSLVASLYAMRIFTLLYLHIV